MLKMRVRRASSVALGASGLVALSGAQLGCVGEPVETEEEGLSEAEAALTPGSGTLAIDGYSGSYSVKLAATTTDEFVRAGETLKISLPAWVLWQELYPSDPLPQDLTRLAKLSAMVTVSAVDKTTTIATLKVPTAVFSGADPWSYAAETKAFVVPTKADWLVFAVSITDADNPGMTGDISSTEMPKRAVFGGELPSKNLFMDQVQTTKRQRVIEGDDPIANAELTIAFTDWRADVVVDKSMIDTQIGTALSGTRFGWVTVPIYGKIVHEVSYGIFFDDAQGWRPEAMLTPNTDSRYLGTGRTVYEGKIVVPAKARRMAFYAHVKTYLVADYTSYSNVQEKWYSDGQQTLKADKYDNPSGAFSNYTFSIANALP